MLILGNEEGNILDVKFGLVDLKLLLVFQSITSRFPSFNLARAFSETCISSRTLLSCLWSSLRTLRDMS